MEKEKLIESIIELIVALKGDYLAINTQGEFPIWVRLFDEDAGNQSYSRKREQDIQMLLYILNTLEYLKWLIARDS